MNTESVRRFPAVHAVSTTKPIAYQGFCRTKSSFGASSGNPRTYPVATITAAPAHSVSPALMCALRSSAVGRNRTKVLLKPSRLT